MKINKNKSKVKLVLKENKEIQIIVKETVQVISFQYLGAILEEKGRQDRELNNKIEKANKIYIEKRAYA